MSEGTNYYNYKKDTLHIENVAVETLVKEVGTPLYVYSLNTLHDRIQQYKHALKTYQPHAQSHQICYSVKANSNLALLAYIAQSGLGFDIVSGGELERVLKAGGEPKKIIFSGVGKREDEIMHALDSGIGCFNIESSAEFSMIQEAARQLKKVAPISVRVNPNVDPQTHSYISTGLKENKFGVDLEEAEWIYRTAHACKHCHILGVDCHIGSQITDLKPIQEAIDKMLIFVDRLTAQGIPIHHLDMGGGLGIPYQQEETPSIMEYIHLLSKRIGTRPLALYIEPGRSIIAESGVLITRTLLIKNNGSKKFAVIDAGMNDLMRPALYQAAHNILPVKKSASTAPHYDIVGPVCETSDIFQKHYPITITSNDYLAIMHAGAYGMAMASNYNTRPRAAEIVVNQDQYYTIRRRETVQDIMALESIPFYQ